jgi:hypothetical protein
MLNFRKALYRQRELYFSKEEQEQVAFVRCYRRVEQTVNKIVSLVQLHWSETGIHRGAWLESTDWLKQNSP